MLLTVAICTWNRASLLEQTLEQFRTVVVPEGAAWELIVVNNNCTDATDEVIARFAQTLPVRRVFEPVPGLSSARNAAVRHARGAYVLWTDDDVLVDPGWLAAYHREIAAHPDVVVLGGPVRPWYEGTPPAWLLQAVRADPEIEAMFAVRSGVDWPATFGRSDMARFPFGANLVIRTEVLRQYPFNPALGRIGTKLLNGEETALIERLFDEGAPLGRWVADAGVKHFIPRDRQTLGFFRRFNRGRGATMVRYGGVGHLVPTGAHHMLGVPLAFWRAAVTGEARFLVRRALRDDRWIPALARATMFQGVVAELLHQRREDQRRRGAEAVVPHPHATSK